VTLAPESALLAVTSTPERLPVAATLDGVIAPRVKVIAGVLVAFATVPDTPFAVTTETLVTVPVPLGHVEPDAQVNVAPLAMVSVSPLGTVSPPFAVMRPLAAMVPTEMFGVPESPPAVPVVFAALFGISPEVSEAQVGRPLVVIWLMN
jgi:hypothetical protein